MSVLLMIQHILIVKTWIRELFQIKCRKTELMKLIRWLSNRIRKYLE